MTVTPISFEDQYFDLEKLSVYSSLDKGTIRDYLRCGMPHFKLKGKILVRKTEFDNWMEGFRADRTEQDLNNMADEIIERMR